jgi:hypothetical protein
MMRHLPENNNGSAAESLKRRVLQQPAALALRVLAKCGFRPTMGTPLWSLPLDLAALGHFVEPELAATLERLRGVTMVSVERLVSLWDQVKYLDQAAVPGALVECGVWKGGSVALMAEAHRRSGAPRRKLHLFDSFGGLPEPDASKDGTRAVRYAGGKASGQNRTIGKSVGTLQETRQLLESRLGYPANLLHYHVGWFSDTIPADADAIGPIALLRLDGDWYESTAIALRHLYPHVQSGGIIALDDYGYWPGCRRAVDELLATLPHPVLLSQSDGSGRYWIKS